MTSPGRYRCSEQPATPRQSHLRQPCQLGERREPSRTIPGASSSVEVTGFEPATFRPPSRADSGVYVSRSVRPFLCVQGRGRSGQIGRCIGYQSGTTAQAHNRHRYQRCERTAPPEARRCFRGIDANLARSKGAVNHPARYLALARAGQWDSESSASPNELLLSSKQRSKPSGRQHA
jgi:hypothetical protein